MDTEYLETLAKILVEKEEEARETERIRQELNIKKQKAEIAKEVKDDFFTHGYILYLDRSERVCKIPSQLRGYIEETVAELKSNGEFKLRCKDICARRLAVVSLIANCIAALAILIHIIKILC